MLEYLQYVKPYHTSKRRKNKYTFYGADEENFEGIGLEIEFDCDDCDAPVHIKHFQNKCALLLGEHPYSSHYFLETDNSLQFGFEIITHPHTVPEMKLLLNNMSDALKELLELGATEEAVRAGLHIHVSRKCFGHTEEEQIDRLAKIICFFANYPTDWVKAGRRKETSKCAVRADLNNKADAIKYVTESYIRNRETPATLRRIERYVAVNLLNQSTVEFRTMQTTLMLDKLLAEIDLVMHIVNKSKNIRWTQVSNVTRWFEGCPNNVLQYLKKVRAFKGLL